MHVASVLLTPRGPNVRSVGTGLSCRILVFVCAVIFLMTNTNPYMAKLAHAQQFSQKITLSNTPPGHTVKNVDAISSGTNAYFAWLDCEIIAVGCQVVFRAIHDSGWSLGPLHQLSDSSIIESLSIAAAGDVIYIVWITTPFCSSHCSDSVSNLVFTRSIDGGNSFDLPRLIATDFDSRGKVSVAADDMRDVYVAWDELSPSNIPGTLFRRTGIAFIRSTDGGVSFSEAVNISGTLYALEPDLAVSGNDVYVAWVVAAEESEVNSTSRGFCSQFCILLAHSSDGGRSFIMGNFSLTRADNGSANCNFDPHLASSGLRVNMVWAGNVKCDAAGPLPNWISPLHTVSFDKGASFFRDVDGGVLSPWDYAKVITHLHLDETAHPLGLAMSASETDVVWVESPYSDCHACVFLRESFDYGSSFGPITSSTYLIDNSASDVTVSSSGSHVYIAWISNALYPGPDQVVFVHHANPTPPVADAGPDQVVDRSALVYLDGSLSNDPDGDPLTYSWTQVDGDAVILTNASSPLPSFRAPSRDQVLTFMLDVSDGVSRVSDLVNILVGHGDLSVRKVTPVQAIFDPDFLINGKHAVLRVEVDSSFPFPVQTKLRIDYDTCELGSNTKFTSIIQLDKPAGDERHSVSPGLNVYYPPFDRDIIPCKNPFTYSAEINPDRCVIIPSMDAHRCVSESDESTESNNRVPSDRTATNSIPVLNTKPYNVLFVPLQLKGDISPSCDDMLRFMVGSVSYIHATFPIGEEKSVNNVAWCDSFTPIYTAIFTPADRTTGNPVDIPIGCLLLDRTACLGDAALKSFTTELDLLRQGTEFDATVGVVRSGWFHDFTSEIQGTVGLAWTGGHRFAAILEESPAWDPQDTAHELAHTLGWVKAGAPNECPPPDDGHLCNVPAPGFSVQSRTDVSSSNPIDFMNPSSRPGVLEWVSKDTFEYLAQKLADPVGSDPTVINVGGTIFKNDTAILDSWYTSNGSSDAVLGQPGEFSLSYLDQAGRQIGTVGFSADFSGPEGRGTDDFAGFSLRIPRLNGTASIVIKHGDQLLAKRSVSPNSPEVKLITPNGGEAFERGEMVNVKWESSDSDGDPLVSRVLLSEDGGRNWIPISAELKDTHFSFPVSKNLVSDSALIRVIVTDGVNTAEDMSDSFFRFNIGNVTSLSPVTSVGGVLNIGPLPQVATSGGSVYAAWIDPSVENGTPDIFFRQSHDNGATFANTINLSNTGNATSGPFIIASGSDVYVSWEDTYTPPAEPLRPRRDVLLRVSHDFGDTFSSTINLSNHRSDPPFVTPLIAARMGNTPIVASGKRVFVLWQDETTNIESEIFLRASDDRGETFRPPLKLSSSGLNYYPSGEASTDNLFVAWSYCTADCSQSQVLSTVSHDGGATFAPILDLSNSTDGGFSTTSLYPQLASSEDDIYVAWENDNATTGEQNIAFRTSTNRGDTFSEVTKLSDDGHSSDPKIAAAGSAVYVIWDDQGLVLRMSSDAGKDFHNIQLLRNGPFTICEDIQASSDRVYVSYAQASASTIELFVQFASSETGGSFNNLLQVSRDGPQPVPCGGGLSVSGTNAYIVWEGLVSAFRDQVQFRRIAPDRPPVSDAGQNQSVVEGTMVILDGSHSYDPDGDPLSYSWTQTGGSRVILIDDGTPTPEFVAPPVNATSTIGFQLIVSDGILDSPPSSMNITVTPTPPGFNDTPPFFVSPPTPEETTIASPSDHEVDFSVECSDSDQGDFTVLASTQSSEPPGLELLWPGIGNPAAQTVRWQPVGPGTVLISFHCTDRKGLSVERTIRIVVTSSSDSISPLISVPGNLVIEANAPSGGIVDYNVTAHDDVDGPVPVSCVPLSGSVVPLGNTTITCRSSDASGNTAIASFIVTVRDSTPPTIIPPDDVTAEATGTLTSVPIGTPTVTDLADPSPIVRNDAPSSFPVGTTIVTWTAADHSGNSATATQQIRIIQQHNTPGKVTGGGAQAEGTNFGFVVQSCNGVSIRGQLEYQDKNGGAVLGQIKLHSTSFTILRVSTDRDNATFGGTAIINGKPGYTFIVTVVDNGDPGKEDSFTITIPELDYTESGLLVRGNIQIHEGSSVCRESEAPSMISGLITTPARQLRKTFNVRVPSNADWKMQSCWQRNARGGTSRLRFPFTIRGLTQ